MTVLQLNRADMRRDRNPSVVCVIQIQIHGPPLPLAVNPNLRLKAHYHNFTQC
jgi:hypothetical protein